MASKRRGFLYLLGAAVVVLVKGADEAAILVGRGADEVIEAGSKSGDEGGSVADDVANVAKRRIRQKAIADLVEDENLSDSITLPANTYTGFKAETRTHTQLSFEFTTLFSYIDILLFDQTGFEAYQNGEDTLPIFGGTVYDALSGEQSVDLEPFSTYYLIVDNTDAGTAVPPDGEVNVEISVSLAVM